jgi:Ca2+-binding EF-hand superfamily protein
MVRQLYILLIRLHPRAFRERFGDEMLSIFDQSASHGNRAWLFADAVSSALRQHVLRPVAEPAPSPLPHNPDGVPLFVAIDGSRPRPWILSYGALLTLAAWCALSIGISTGNHNRAARVDSARAHRLVAKASQSSQTRNQLTKKYEPPRLLRMLSFFGVEPAANLDADTLILKRAGSGSPTDRTKTADQNPAHVILTMPRTGTDVTFDPLFNALDSDLDSNLSAFEIARASEALLKLDANQDRSLTREECGIVEGLTRTSYPWSRTFAALDTDHDGTLSPEEIANAPMVLARLDKNHDGRLTKAEIEDAVK